MQGSRTSSRNDTSLNPEANKRNVVEEGVKEQTQVEVEKKCQIESLLFGPKVALLVGCLYAQQKSAG